MRDFRNLDTRLRAQAFLDELHALMVKHEFSIACSGMECDGIDLDSRAPTGKLVLPKVIYPGYHAFSVTLEVE